MVLIVSILIEALGFFFGIFVEVIGAGIWGLLETIFSKSATVAVFFLISLVISAVLFCTMSNSLHAAMWSVAEIFLMLVFAFAIDAAAK
jgi:hypothetical protein